MATLLALPNDVLGLCAGHLPLSSLVPLCSTCSDLKSLSFVPLGATNGSKSGPLRVWTGQVKSVLWPDTAHDLLGVATGPQTAVLRMPHPPLPNATNAFVGAAQLHRCLRAKSLGRTGFLRLLDALPAALTLGGNIFCLDLSWSGMSADGAASLATVLRQAAAFRDRDGARGVALSHLKELTLCGATSDLNRGTVARPRYIGSDGARHIAQALPACTGLTALDLSCCYIRSAGAVHLAAALTQDVLRRLETLVLSNNDIMTAGAKALSKSLSVPPSDCRLPSSRFCALRRLDLACNSIDSEGATALCAALRSMKGNNALETLQLGMNPIRHGGATQLSEVLSTCSSLQTLDLHVCMIACDGASALAQALPRCPRLTSLNVGGNSIKDRGAIALAAALPSCPALSHLDLSALKVADSSAGTEASTGAAAVVRCLPHMPHLSSLDISSTSLWGAASSELSQSVAACTKLTSLRLSSCPNFAMFHAYSVSINDVPLPRIKLQHGLPASLTNLDIGDYAIDDGGFQACTPALASCSQLQCLSLIDNKLTMRAFETAQSLPQFCSSLLELRLCGNDKLGDGIAHWLADVLPQRGLQLLDLSKTGLTSSGILRLAQALPSAVMGPLHVLRLSGNRDCGDAGAAALAAVLEASTVADLSLASCGIGDAGCSAIAGSASKLCKLELGGNRDIGNAGVIDLCNVLSKGRSNLHRLGLGATGMGDEGATGLSKAIKAMPSLMALDMDGCDDIGHSGWLWMSEALPHAPGVQLKPFQGGGFASGPF